MAEFSRQHRGAARRAERIGAKHILIQSAFFGQSVNVGRFDVRASVSADGLQGVVVRKQDQDVGTFVFGLKR